MTSSTFTSRVRSSSPMNRLPAHTQERLLPLVEGDLPSPLLQNLLAIIHFPRQQNELPDRHLIIDRHLETWGKEGFVNPFTTEDEDTVRRLVSMWLRVVDLVEDYLGKAVNEYPTRAYHELPGSYLEGSASQAFNIGDLTASERTRIIRAFLRHELMCQIYHPRCQAPPETSSNKQPDLLNGHWDWETLARYRPQKWDHWDTEELSCVHDYLSSLYGALFARESAAWLPCRPTTRVPRRRGAGLAFPDNVFFDPAAYAHDLGLHPSMWGTMAFLLASYGMDLATNVLADAKLGTINAQWLRDLSTLIRSSDTTRQFGWMSSIPGGFIRERDWDPEMDQEREYEPFTLPALELEQAKEACIARAHHEWHGLLHSRLCQDAICFMVPKAVTTQFNVYRQRAWVFFDDCRFYPKPWASHFPDYPEFQAMVKEASAAYMALRQARILRRSRAWHEAPAPNKEILRGMSAAENDGDEEGQVYLHPTQFLQHWLRPFWEPERDSWIRWQGLGRPSEKASTNSKMIHSRNT